MDLAEILEPIGEAMVWSFDNLIVPLGNIFNGVVVLLIVGGIALWIKMQLGYNKKADKEGVVR